jgi:hypothetical protein
MASRHRRMNPVFTPYTYNGNQSQRLPYVFPADDKVQRLSDDTLTISATAYPDDVLHTALTMCLSVHDLSEEERRVLTQAGLACLMAMDHRAIRRHGYDNDPEKRAYRHEPVKVVDGLDLAREVIEAQTVTGDNAGTPG